MSGSCGGSSGLDSSPCAPGPTTAPSLPASLGLGVAKSLNVGFEAVQHVLHVRIVRNFTEISNGNQKNPSFSKKLFLVLLYYYSSV